MSNRPPSFVEGRVRTIVQNIKSLDRHRPEAVFGDFVEMSAIAISNAVDLHHREVREQRYMDIVKGYTQEELTVMCRLLAEVLMALDEAPRDVLGEVWAGLELRGEHLGQFFTPYQVSLCMAKMTFHAAEKIIDEHGFVSAAELCCGPGGMIVAMAHAMRDEGINYQEKLHVTAIDIDRRCVHMAYIQTSLMHVPAVIYRGDTLGNEFDDVWFTPAHIMGGWSGRLRDRKAREKAAPVWQSMSFAERVMLLRKHEIDLSGAVTDTLPLDLPAKALEATA